LEYKLIFVCIILPVVRKMYNAKVMFSLFASLNVGNHINTLNAELNPICQLLALLGAHHIFHVSGLRVNHVEEKAKLYYCII